MNDGLDEVVIGNLWQKVTIGKTSPRPEVDKQSLFTYITFISKSLGKSTTSIFAFYLVVSRELSNSADNFQII